MPPGPEPHGTTMDGSGAYNLNRGNDFQKPVVAGGASAVAGALPPEGTPPPPPAPPPPQPEPLWLLLLLLLLPVGVGGSVAAVGAALGYGVVRTMPGAANGDAAGLRSTVEDRVLLPFATSGFDGDRGGGDGTAPEAAAVVAVVATMAAVSSSAVRVR